jgi:hypothetical protein
VSYDFGDDLSKIRNLYGVDYVQKIMNRLTKLSTPKVDNEVYIRHVLHDDLIFDKTNQISYNRWVPLSVPAYGITHTETGTMSFPTTGLKYGGGATLNGTQYTKLDPYGTSTDMDIGSGDFSLELWTKSLGAGTYGIFCKRNTASATNQGIDLYFSGGNTINCRIADGANSAGKTWTTSDLTSSTWKCFQVNVPASGNMEAFENTVSLGTQATGSVGSLTNSRSGYLWGLDNAGAVTAKMVGTVAWLVIKKELLDSTQRNDFYQNGILDLDGSTTVELTTVPYCGNNNPMPNCAAGMWYSS